MGIGHQRPLPAPAVGHHAGGRAGEAALARLKPDDRVVLALRYYRDLRIDDIASLLDIPSGTATSRLRAAHQRLREILRDEELSS